MSLSLNSWLDKISYIKVPISIITSQLVLWYRSSNCRSCLEHVVEKVSAFIVPPMLSHAKNTVKSGLYCLLGRHQLICSSSTPTPCWVGQPPASSRPVAVPWHDMHPTARRLVPCRLRHHSCWRHYAYTMECRGPRLHARPSTAAAAARWSRLIAAAFTFTRGIQKLPRCSGVARLLCKNNPPHDHSQVIRRPHAKSCPDPLNIVTAIGNI